MTTRSVCPNCGADCEFPFRDVGTDHVSAYTCDSTVLPNGIVLQSKRCLIRQCEALRMQLFRAEQTLIRERECLCVERAGNDALVCHRN